MPEREKTGYLNDEVIVEEVSVVVMRPKGTTEGLAIEFAIDRLQVRYNELYEKDYKPVPGE